MSRKTGQKSLATLITHASMIALIALIAMVMPIGADVSNNGDAWFGAPFSHAAHGGAPSSPGPSETALGAEFGGSAEQDGRDLTEQEEQDLISRGWQ